jgi:hypothetical protein
LLSYPPEVLVWYFEATRNTKYQSSSLQLDGDYIQLNDLAFLTVIGLPSGESDWILGRHTAGRAKRWHSLPACIASCIRAKLLETVRLSSEKQAACRESSNFRGRLM